MLTNTGDREDAPTLENEELAAAIYSRLPRELRNRIYTFCVQGSYDNEVIVRRAADSKGTFTLLTRACTGLHSYHWIEDPITHYLSARRLGLDVARELLESYYWTRTFKFGHHELCLLKTFLGTDQLGLGLIPAKYARRLQLQIQPFPCAMLGMPETGKFEEDRCCRAIEALATIQTARMRVGIEIELAHGSVDYVDWERTSDDAGGLLRKMLGIVHRLKNKGLCIETAINETWDERKRSEIVLESACSLKDCTIDITSSFRLACPEEVI